MAAPPPNPKSNAAQQVKDDSAVSQITGLAGGAAFGATLGALAGGPLGALAGGAAGAAGACSCAVLRVCRRQPRDCSYPACCALACMRCIATQQCQPVLGGTG
jgi:hypothetical protein